MTIPLLLLVVHFVADFLFQTDWMAINKSKQWDALALHCLVYSACFLVVTEFPVPFVLVTFATHFTTDAITSRITTRLWQADQRHWFFVVIGLDQLIHATTLALTWAYLVGA